MTKPTLSGSSTSTRSDRMFVYEVVGLRQNEQTDQSTYDVRNSASIFLQVPRSRMNYEMQRINRLGGRIVNIQGLGEQREAGSEAE